MKRKISKIPAVGLLLAFVLCFGAFGGCGGKRNLNGVETGDGPQFDGQHTVVVEETEKWLTRNGRSDYRIVVPTDCSRTVSLAASELRQLLGDASGVNPDIVEEADAPTDCKFISVGRTQRLAAANIAVDVDTLGLSGYRIVTQDDNIYICGGGNLGTRNGVYGFLRETVGFRTYAFDEVQTRKGDVKLYDYDITDVPDIQYRTGDGGYKTVDGDETYRMRLRYDSDDEVFAFVKGSLFHNTDVYFPKDDYGENRDWYSETNGMTDYIHLCYTAHGKEEELVKMLDIASDTVVEALQENDAENVTFTQADANVWCSCPSCVAMRNKYGTDAAVVIRFVNRLSDTVRQKLDAAGETERRFNLVFFAYHRTENAPAVKNGDGTYRAIDDSVVCRDNVYALLAPIFAYYNQSMLSDYNSMYAENIKAWKAVSPKTFLWTYQTNFSNYLYPYNTLPSTQERYRFIAEQGATFYYDQTQWDQTVRTGFHRLKVWLGAELMWDVNADYFALLDEYFNGYFYDAAAPMRALFDSVTYHMEYLRDTTDMTGDINFPVNQAKYFSSSLLDGWMQQIEKAYAAVEKYSKTNPALYKKLHDRINLESISVRFIQLDLYASKFSPVTLEAERKEFMNDFFALGLSNVAERREIEEVFGQWGLM